MGGGKLLPDNGELRARFQMIHIGILLSTIGLVYGIIGNYIRDVSGYLLLELILIGVNIGMSILLRNYKNALEFVATLMTAQYTFFFLYLVYVSEPNELKHIWLFTYSIILLYFQGSKKSLYWFVFLVSMLLIAPFQGFVDVKYSFYQLSYISFVLIIINTIIYFYQIKMDEANAIIFEHQNKMIERENFLRKELHHRIKNNMQFIISLFKLKLHPYINDDIRRVLKEVTYKILGITSVHDMLYMKKSLIGINTNEYFTKLISALKNGYETKNVKFDVSVETQLSADALMYVGLIVNEVIINALKYAFDENGGVITLRLYKDGERNILKLSDNGKGMDNNVVESFGTEMIRSLISNELGGEMQINTENGVCYSFYL